MALVNSNQMLRKAKNGGYAVGAFNVENMEMAQAVISAAAQLRAPVILQTTPSTLRYADPALYAANVDALAREVDVPVALHLDHGSNIGLCVRALRAGYTSVMIDGSKLPLAENITLTREVAGLCAAAGVPVEGELGSVGGKEDDLEGQGDGYTIPEEAILFERETGVSSLAVGIGTAHGVYKQTPVLNVELIACLKTLLRVPMVMHGASGLDEAAVRSCIRRGICKVNFATELRQAYTGAVRRVLQEQPEVFDPKVYGKEARLAVEDVVKARIRICGCEGKA